MAKILESIDSVDLSNACETDIDPGECGGKFMRYGFDRQTNECRRFQYSGCGGNFNNFASLTECKKKCLKKDAIIKESALRNFFGFC